MRLYMPLLSLLNGATSELMSDGAAAAPRRGVSLGLLGLLAAALLLAGCHSAPRRAAPVEDRIAGVNNPLTSGTPTLPGQPAPLDETKPLPGAENAGKPGYYTVKQGDTLIRIGLDSGQNWKDIVKWNSLENANVIEVGQVLRVVPPGTDPNAVATRGVSSSRVDQRPLDARATPVLPPAAAAASSPTVVATAPVVPPAPAPAPENRGGGSGDDDVNWMWPANGAVISSYDEVKSKGLSIAGRAGEPVVAAADGRVVYAGSGLRGYGNLVIIKHNNTYLTAYAHNQTLLVKEDQNVRRGQKIAEMGSTDSDRVQLHFEIRKLGKPIDPARLLPPR